MTELYRIKHAKFIAKADFTIQYCNLSTGATSFNTQENGALVCSSEIIFKRYFDAVVIIYCLFKGHVFGSDIIKTFFSAFVFRLFLVFGDAVSCIHFTAFT